MTPGGLSCSRIAGRDRKYEGRVLCGPAFFMSGPLFPAIKSLATGQKLFRLIVILNDLPVILNAAGGGVKDLGY